MNRAADLALQLGLAAAVACGTGAAIAPPSQADMTTFGSSLSVPATIDTATGLNYVGQTYIVYGTGAQVHVNHDGADTPLWNAALANGSPSAPAAGQVVALKLEGCAAPGRGVPLVDIHFQDLKPGPGGAVTVNVTSQTFQVPVCGQSGASGTTVTTYAPTNFCVAAGDLVDFNDEGGFDANIYPSGVPFQVIGAVPGSTMNSFIRNNGTNNGATFSPTDTSKHDGFAVNRDRELLLQAQLATGADATPLCGGTRGIKAPTPVVVRSDASTVVIRAQRDGVNRRRLVKVGYFCSGSMPCTGTLTLSSGGTVLGAAPVNSPGHKNARVSVRLSAAALHAIRAHDRRMIVAMTVSLAGGATFAGSVTLII